MKILNTIFTCFVLLFVMALTANAQGLPSKTCSDGHNRFLCLDDIVVVDGSGYNYAGTAKDGGVYLVNPSSGDQTPISTGGYLNQAAFLTLEPGTGKILVTSRTYGVVRIDPQTGGQEIIMRGGTGWGSPFPTFADTANSNATESFYYPAGISVDPITSDILVVDAGMNLFSTTLSGGANCSNPSDVLTCEALPGKVIRIKHGQGAGVYTTKSVLSKGGLLSRPFSIVVDDGGGPFVTSMSGVLGGANDPGKGGIVHITAWDASTGNPITPPTQEVYFSSYLNNPSATGCPMGLTRTGNYVLYFTVFSYNGFGCVSNQGIFTLTPDPNGVNPPTLATVINGTPMAFPFGMDPDRSGRPIIADEGSGYGCSGTIFRYDSTQPVMRVYDSGWTINNLNPYALSPKVGLGCSPSNQTWLSTPSNLMVVKSAVACMAAYPLCS